LKHLHAVLHENDDKESAITTKTESDKLPSTTDNTKEMITSGKNRHLIND